MVVHVFQWIDDSAYSYRHHTPTRHKHSSGQFFLSKGLIVEQITGHYLDLLDRAAHNYHNDTCYAVVSNFVTSYEWIPVSESNI